MALAALLLPTEGGAPTEFRILRAGANKTEKGEFLFDEQAAEAVMAAYAAKGLGKVQIDYEHQSMVAPPGGGDAAKPAAGWFRPEVRAGELWATDVAWTARAAGDAGPRQAGAPEYRFFSPVLRFDEDTRRVRSLKNLALTNDPAMDELHPLVAATARKEDDMECAELHDPHGPKLTRRWRRSAPR
jgi:phage I-like protein